jgi:hypothetical protein
MGAVMTEGRAVSPDFSPVREKTDTRGRAAIFDEGWVEINYLRSSGAVRSIIDCFNEI